MVEYVFQGFLFLFGMLIYIIWASGQNDIDKICYFFPEILIVICFTFLYSIHLAREDNI